MNMKDNRSEEIDVIIPIALDLNWITKKDAVSTIVEAYEKYGFTRYMLSCPCGGWRSITYPPREVFIKFAHMFTEIRNELKEYPIDIGWWVTTTIKSGPSPRFNRQVKADGSTHDFANCPIDDDFKKQFSEDVAVFAEIAKPSFIITEDDYTIHGANGCFCENHLKAFAEKYGRYYSREELVDALSKRSQESIEIIRKWREVLKDSLVGLAETIRKAVDVKSPEIPIGYMQTGGIDYEGACTEEIGRALSGPSHTPFTRCSGAFYCGFKAKELPLMIFRSLHTKQHIKGDFTFYYESDTYPHTRHFTTGSQMNAIMGIAYSYAFDGATFQAFGLLDNPIEETAYSKMFASERARFNTVNRIAKKCDLAGISLEYDSFWNTVILGKSNIRPLWTSAVTRFGIPFTTLSSNVAFWDERQAQYSDEETIIEALSKGLFLDGEAAKCLCERGYGKYIGVEIGDDVLIGNTIINDLAAREIICDNFATENEGRYMHAAHIFAPSGNGKLLEMKVIDDRCEVVSELYTYEKKLVSPAMTRFENSLGGRIVVMGMTLNKNNSQALINYRRARLIQNLLTWCNDEYAFIKDAPDVYTIMNVAKEGEKDGFLGMVTLINLCEDRLDDVKIHLPKQWNNMTQIKAIDKNGELAECRYTRIDDDIVVEEPLDYLVPMYLVIE